MAAALRDSAKLAFVNAPIADSTGDWLRLLNDQYSVAVFPFIDVEPTAFDLFPSESDLYDAIRVVGQIHVATNLKSSTSLPEASFHLSKREEPLQALRELDVPWNAGPYSEPARQLISEHKTRLLQRLDRFDQIAAEVLADKRGWVITHGEPHAGNIIRTRSGSMAVVDWAFVALAPPERDLWMLLDEDHPGWATYGEITNTPSLSKKALCAYRLQWNLGDIAVFVSMCRSPHDQTEEKKMIWAELELYVSEVTLRLCKAS